MMRITDGGKTFVRATYPSALGPGWTVGGKPFWFANADDGYLYVSSPPTFGLYWTWDGGKTWRLIQPGDSPAWRDSPVSGPLASPIRGITLPRFLGA